ncbi:MAG: hypothetical protein BWK76_28215 [Desulfobulbaceae bacterium A2]|nr:MAG: hypothetical protein BWK76_28215 [Desulfobulbaceae bacterium A2]
MTKKYILDAALQLLAGGFSVLPCGADKRPVVPSWKAWQTAPMSTGDAHLHFRSGAWLAVICGAVSGGLEDLDIDDGRQLEAFIELVREQNPDLADKLIYWPTPGGGYSMPYRIMGGVAGGSKKLAYSMHPVEGEGEYPVFWRKDGKRYKAQQAPDGSWFVLATALETKAEGGYFLVPPSPGYGPYPDEKTLLDVPVLTVEEVALLHSTAKAFCQALRRQSPEHGGSSSRSGETRPGDAFNEAHSCAEVLSMHGWSEAQRVTAGMGWTRPGKDGGVSGVVLDQTGNFYCWSTNSAPLEAGQSYTAFGLFAALEHGGDFRAAAVALGRTGYGDLARTKVSGQGEDQEEIELAPLPEWPVLPPEALRGLPGDFVHLACENSEADPAAVLLTFLPRAGVECGRGPVLHVGDTPHRLRLDVVIVGASSKARKGTSGRPVKKLFDFEGAARSSPGPFSSGEGIIYGVRDKVEGADKKGETVILDAGVDDKRLFVLDEEFAGVLANTKREGNTLTTVLRCCWDGGNLDPLTKTTKTRATGAHVGWVSHITLHELHAKLPEAEGLNGFGNRILWCCAKRSGLQPFPQPMDAERLAGLQERLQHVLKFASTVGEVRLSPESRDLWAGLYAELSADRPGFVGIITNRAEAQVLRLALLYAVLDCKNLIEPAHLQAALAVWRYCEQSAQLIFHGRAADQTQQKILDALVAGPMTGTELYRDVFKNHTSRERLQQALSELAAAGKICSDQQRGKGRPVTCYSLKHACVKSVKSVESTTMQDDAGLITHNTLITQAPFDFESSPEGNGNHSPDWMEVEI